MAVANINNSVVGGGIPQSGNTSTAGTNYNPATLNKIDNTNNK